MTFEKCKIKHPKHNILFLQTLMNQLRNHIAKNPVIFTYKGIAFNTTIGSYVLERRKYRGPVSSAGVAILCGVFWPIVLSIGFLEGIYLITDKIESKIKY